MSNPHNVFVCETIADAANKDEALSEYLYNLNTEEFSDFFDACSDVGYDGEERLFEYLEEVTKELKK